MKTKQIIRALVKVAGNSLKYEAEAVRTSFRKAVTKNLHKEQIKETEQDLIKGLAPWVSRQIDDVQKSLASQTGTDAEKIMNSIFDEKKYYDDLIDTTLPILAEGMSRAALGYFATFGVDLKKSAKTRTKETLPIGATSRASQWLASNGEELPPGILADLPPWIQASIAEQLQEAFSQDYWLEIAGTTKKDVEVFLRNGLIEGQSIREIAKNISEHFPDLYSKNRATRIARTESGNALNGARKASFEKLRDELGEVPMYEEWLSVLADSTRDSHANLDGVASDKDGMWELGGVKVPWPGHFSLSAEQRINCMCTTVTTFGIPEGEAIGKIQDLF